MFHFARQYFYITLPKDTYSAESVDKTWMHARTPQGHAGAGHA